ncbi:MAG: hypothetical protein Q8M59_06605 [Tabrizicola sp.]|uniref:hypothetical protein n=1 Tax=Tabrizicola sp. TaxID=2005166 RepID=UPI002734D759|nr:hypothetical protein [Tabrizicola sp.]MDP3262621.1 hypothetical protein [Tabrizicola sp.]MDP3647781.1 hypothetical protein [Paracoccaceae bacterium]
MIPGLGLVRRTVTLALCAGSFWAGIQFARLGDASACTNAGGAINDRGICIGGRE